MERHLRRIAATGAAACLLLSCAQGATPPVSSPAELAKQMASAAPAEAQKQLIALGTKAVPAVLPLLDSQDASVRAAAATVLAEIDDVRAVQPLARRLGDDDRRVSYTAAWALRKIGEPAAEALAAQLVGPNGAARFPAAYALAAVKSFKRVEPWLHAVKDADARVRYYAVIALGTIRDAKAADALTAALEDKDPRVRSVAPLALAKLPGARAEDGLAAALSEDLPLNIRFQAVFEAWEKRTPNAVDLMIRGILDSDARVRHHCAWALGNLEAKKGIDPLIKVLEADLDQQHVHYAAVSLSQITGQDFGREGVKWRLWYTKRHGK